MESFIEEDSLLGEYLEGTCLALSLKHDDDDDRLTLLSIR